MTDNPHNIGSNDEAVLGVAKLIEQRDRALGKLLDLSLPISKLHDIVERASALHRDLRSQVDAATGLLSDLFQALDDEAIEEAEGD